MPCISFLGLYLSTTVYLAQCTWKWQDVFCNITQEILALPSLSSSEPCQSAVARCHGTVSKPSLVGPVRSCMGSCFMSCVYWRGSKGRRRQRFIYLLPRFLLWGSCGRNCKTASGISNSIKDMTVGTIMEGKWAHYLIWLAVKDFCSKASAVIEDLVGQAVEYFQDTSDVCCHCYASLCFLFPILLSWIEYNLQISNQCMNNMGLHFRAKIVWSEMQNFRSSC